MITSFRYGSHNSVGSETATFACASLEERLQDCLQGVYATCFPLNFDSVLVGFPVPQTDCHLASSTYFSFLVFLSFFLGHGLRLNCYVFNDFLPTSKYKMCSGGYLKLCYSRLFLHRRPLVGYRSYIETRKGYSWSIQPHLPPLLPS